jgi:glycyl-tRNA synthetase (class II)
MSKEHLIANGFLWGPEHSPYGVSGFMTYPPIGKRLKLNIESEFRKVFQKEGFEEIETPILYPERAWEASGHLQRFKREMFHTETPDGQALIGRSEMATTIYPLFGRLLDYYKGRMPFKIYQMGIVLPNDRQTEWQIRTRQYTAHEGHIFFEMQKIDVKTTIAYLEGLSYELMERGGIRRDSLIFREKETDKRPFYATKAYALYTKTANDKELELLGVQYRSSWDFERHSKATGVPLKVNGNYPEVFEISFSTDRPFLVTLEQALRKIEGRAVLQLPDHLVPIPAVIFPLKNTQDLYQKAADLSDLLSQAGFEIPVLEQGPIGQRYKRADAIGVPYIFTLDEPGLNDDSLTLRERDTRVQVRITTADIAGLLSGFKTKATIIDLARKLFELGKSRG